MPGKLTSTLRRMAGGSSGSLAANLRRKRFEHTRQLLERVPKPYLMLDVGGTQGFWETVGMCGETEHTRKFPRSPIVGKPYQASALLEALRRVLGEG